jgi:prepilin-type N-terminal cleavage/methylation domain-containing protein
MKRSGFTLMETAAAVVLLAAAATICVQMIAVGAANRAAADQRRTATREAANVMERLMAGPRDRLTPEAAKQITLSGEAIEALPEAKLDVALEEPADGGPAGTRLTVTITWKGRAGQTVRPVRLVAWRYDAVEDES